MNETTNLKPFYITFGSNKQFPYPNDYIVVVAASEKEASEKFREKYPDVTPGVYNFSFMYEKEKWENGIKEHFKFKPAEIMGVSPKAIEYINTFSQEVHGEDADFEDLEEIPLFYTTVDDEEEHDFDIPIQINANLIDCSIERYLDNILFEKRTFKTEEEFLWALENLEKYELIRVTDEQFVLYHRTRALNYLARTQSSEKQNDAVTMEANPYVLTVSVNLEELVKNNLVIAGYRPTTNTVKEVLDCVCINPFNMSKTEFLNTMLRAKLVEEVEEAISFLDKPEIQNAKGKED